MQPNPSDCSLFHDNRVETPLLQKSSGLENQSHDAWEKPQDDTKRRAQSSAKRLILGKTLDQAQEFFLYGPDSGVCRRQQGAARLYHIREFKHGLTVPRIRDCRACRGYAQYPSKAGTTGPCVKEPPLKAESQLENIQRETDDQNEFAQDGPHAQVPRG